jgi:hypothetical protein
MALICLQNCEDLYPDGVNDIEPHTSSQITIIFLLIPVLWIMQTERFSQINIQATKVMYRKFL